MEFIRIPLSEAIKHLSPHSEKELEKKWSEESDFNLLDWSYWDPLMPGLWDEITRRGLKRKCAEFHKKRIKFQTTQLWDDNDINNLIRNVLAEKTNESVKHLSGRSEEEIDKHVSKMAPAEKLEFALHQNDTNLAIKAIDEDESIADWFLLHTAINFSNYKLTSRLLSINNLKESQYYLIVTVLEQVKEFRDVNLMEKLLRRNDVIENLTDDKYEYFENWLHRKHIDQLKDDQIFSPEDSKFESLLNESLNEEFNIEKLRTIISKIRDKNALADKIITKFNEAKNFKSKKYFASLLVIMFLINFASKNNQWADLSREAIGKPATEITKLPKIEKADILKILKDTNADIFKISNIKPPKLHQNNDFKLIKIDSPIAIESAKTSKEGKNLIKNHEKLRLTAYKIGDGMVTIGWGHAQPISKSKYTAGVSTITEEQAAILFAQDIQRIEKGVKRIFSDWEKKGIKVQINQSMFDAMVSMGFNMGIDGLRGTDFIQQLKKKNYKEAADLIKISPLAKKFPGIQLRRNDEHKMFTKQMP